ncbi:MAG: hypothetical protein ACRD3K_11765, partial [Edaphobacter sp.]
MSRAAERSPHLSLSLPLPFWLSPDAPSSAQHPHQLAPSAEHHERYKSFHSRNLNPQKQARSS